MANKFKYWTDEEVNWLQEKWGTWSVSKIASRLKRTETSVERKASRLGLGGAYGNDGNLTLCSLIRAIYPTGRYATVADRLIKNGLPFRFVKMRKQSVKVVNLDSFWKWAESHKDTIDWSKLEENLLGIEPKWVAERRKIDFYNRKDNCRRSWSIPEEEYLRKLVASGKDIVEIAKIMGRSQVAIRRMCYLLYLEQPKTVAQQRWSKADVETALKMKSEGYHNATIAEVLGRTELSIAGKIRKCKNGVLIYGLG